MKTEERITGQRAIRGVYPSYKHHHAPMWFKKAIRQGAIRRGEWRPSYSTWSQFVHCPLWDHWGSFQHPDDEKNRWVLTQPYGADLGFALKFSEEHGFELVEYRKHSPHHPMAELYAFRPKDA